MVGGGGSISVPSPPPQEKTPCPPCVWREVEVVGLAPQNLPSQSGPLPGGLLVPIMSDDR